MTRRIFFLLLLFSLAGTAWAVSSDQEGYTRLARLSYIEGPVSYQHATDVDWAAASINLPLEPGDRIYTGPDGRAEIEFDDGSVYRLARSTDVEILSLKEDLIQLRVLVGLSTLVVSGDTDFEIDTPAAALNTLRQGIYRFSVDENGDSDAIVRKGRLEVANNNFSRRIESGEMLHLSPRDGANPQVARYERRDDWDEWNDRRDADLSAYGSPRYLPDTVYMGVSDLHRYGRWVEVEAYGSAWVPFSVGVYWSPYSVGRWCYRPLFGWTWVSYEPWGWLPYHYGRWYRSAVYGWCWLPGPSFGFNFWSPGLVAFYTGPGWISWCPLGPGDYYNVNYYHYNRGIYGHQLSQLLALQTRAQGNYFNRNAPHAYRTASIDQFRNGSFGGRNRGASWMNVDQPWKRGQLVKDSLSIRPTAMSYRADPDRQAARPSRSSSLPAVIRSNPEYNSRGQGHFTRITNPQIPALPSRAERRENDQKEAGSGAGARANTRVIQTPQRNRANPAAQAPSRNGTAEQGGRRISTYRWSGTSSNAGERSNSAGNSSPAERPTAAAPAGRQDTSRGRSEQAAPQQRQMSRTPSGSGGNSAPARKPDTSAPATRQSTPRERSDKAAPERQQLSGTFSQARQNPGQPYRNNYVESRSFTSRARGSDPAAVTVAPRANTLPSYGPSRASSSRTYSSPRQPGISFDRHTSAARSSSTPSYNPGGANSSPSFGNSRGGGSSGSFSRGSQKAQQRGSSGGGRSRRK